MIEEDPHGALLVLEFSLVTEAEAPSGLESGDFERLSRYVLDAEDATGCWQITVALVGDERLQALHRDFMGIDTPTDIMTFPTDDSGAGCAGGELVISVDHARTQAAAWGLSSADEIRFLVIHGLLHLLDWRDETDEERDRMLTRQHMLFDGWRSVD